MLLVERDRGEAFARDGSATIGEGEAAQGGVDGFAGAQALGERKTRLTWQSICHAAAAPSITRDSGFDLLTACP